MGEWARGMTSDVPGIEAQAGDISFHIGFAPTLPDTNMTEVAVGGFSWGGISNIFKFNVSLNPDSGNVYDSLAEGYVKSGQKDLAILY